MAGIYSPYLSQVPGRTTQARPSPRNVAMPQVYIHSAGANPKAAQVYLNAAANFAARPQTPVAPPVPPTQVTNVDPSSPYYNGSPVNASPLPGPASPPGPAAAPPGTAPLDYSSDPILQQFYGQDTRNRQGLSGDLLENQKRILTGFGSRELASKILGQNDPSLDAIGNNPFSTLANLTTQYGQQRYQTNEAENQQNLWFSSDRQRLLGELGQQELGAKAAASNTAEGTLAQLMSNYLSQLQGLGDQRLTQEGNAYQRAIQAAAANALVPNTGTDLGTSGTPGNPAVWGLPPGQSAAIQPFGPVGSYSDYGPTLAQQLAGYPGVPRPRSGSRFLPA